MFCLLSQVLNVFDMSQTGPELVRFHWHISSREKLVISREFMGIDPVELVNSLTEHVKSRVVVYWVN